MKTKLIFAAMAAAFSLATSAQADRNCLQQSLIYSWNALDDRTLIVEDKFRNKFKLSLMMPCQHLQFHQNLGFRTFSNTALSCITKGDQVISGTPIGPQNCPIKSIEPYTPEMEKADKAAADAAKAAAH